MDDIQKLKEVLINGNPMLFLGQDFCMEVRIVMETWQQKMF